MTSGKPKAQGDNISVDFADPALDTLEDQDDGSSVDTAVLEKQLKRKDAPKVSCGNAKTCKTSLSCHQRNCSHLLLRRQRSSLMRQTTQHLR
jgi:hypothetical protein